MNKTQALLIKILVVANVLVYAGAGWLLWYIWPVLIEPPAEASASRYMVPVSAPTQTPAVNLAISEQSFLTPSLRLTPKYATRTASEPLEPPISTPIPAPTPQTLLWPSKDPEGLEGNSRRGLGAPNPLRELPSSPSGSFDGHNKVWGVGAGMGVEIGGSSGSEAVRVAYFGVSRSDGVKNDCSEIARLTAGVCVGADTGTIYRLAEASAGGSIKTGQIYHNSQPAPA